MTLFYSYNINLNAREVKGVNSSDYQDRELNFVTQANNAALENANTLKLEYKLGAGQSVTLPLTGLGVRFLQTVCIKSTQAIQFSWSGQVAKGTDIFITSKAPATLPITTETSAITLLNNSGLIADITLVLLVLV